MVSIVMSDGIGGCAAELQIETYHPNTYCKLNKLNSVEQKRCIVLIFSKFGVTEEDTLTFLKKAVNIDKKAIERVFMYARGVDLGWNWP